MSTKKKGRFIDPKVTPLNGLEVVKKTFVTLSASWLDVDSEQRFASSFHGAYGR